MKKVFNLVETAPGRASLMLYGQIGPFEDGVDAERVVAEILAAQSLYPALDVHINSQGGEVFAGIAIYNALKDSTSRIDIYVDGVAASIAGVIALCGKPLHMSRYSRLMLHQVSAGCSGGARELRECADLIEGLEDTLSQMISAKCGMTPEAVRATYFDGSDHWMTAQEAYDRRLCDYVYDLSGASELGSGATAEQVYRLVNSLSTSPNYNKMNVIDELKKDSSFKDLSDEQIVAKVRTLANDAAKVPAMQAKIDALEGEKTAAREAANTAYLQQAVAEGRISADQVENYRKLMAADEASVRALIDAAPKKAPQVNINDVLKGVGAAPTGSTGDLAKMTWDEIDRAERLAELKNEHPDLYAAKYREKFGA